MVIEVVYDKINYMSDLSVARIVVTGGDGFLGRHLLRELKKAGARSVVAPTRDQCDLLTWLGCQQAVAGQEIVIHAAAKVGGIGANRDQPGAFFYENIIMGVQLLEAARQAGVKKFVQIGSVCSYPKELSSVPYRETDLWAGYPEETNAAYGLAKKALLAMGQAYRSQYNINVIHLLQVNLYGPGDRFGSFDSHVIPALIDRFWRAREAGENKVICWGTGSPTREFLYVEDAAHGIALATQHYEKSEPVNLGSGQEISIKALAETIANIIGYHGELVWDKTKPDGQPRRLFDSSRAEQEFGFRATTNFTTGLRCTIAWYAKHIAKKTSKKPSADHHARVRDRSAAGS